ncbi:oxidoreductase domain protein [Dethiobacter alkaliphilus AHT 1]|uniref:Oxidoreductase domain protein n=1 Tax=Dethiobacter alkaliphilus AHT 1 TaxID=555088 RepID=C0GIF1_DETAL|nr:Gfo/Idh/MocA family oxidoreductase [Dethiobacter alkaliphilus]EEG76812.1 oxidoreductase domain protein [Dethiobacter alkaliphilus AHT 1]
MKQLKVGIIGTGMAFERLHYPAFQELSHRYQISALCDIDKNKAQQWAKRLNLQDRDVYTDYLQMIETHELDLVDILVPIELNFTITEAVARKWAKKQKGIICEKPLAPNLSQAKQARTLARDAQIPIMIAEHYRYNEEVNLIRDFVHGKKIGDVSHFIYNRFMDFPQEMVKNEFPAREWRQHPEYPGGAITDAAVHEIAGLQHIFGAVTKVHALGRPQQAEFSPYSVIQANLQFSAGVTGQFTFYCAGQEAQRPLTGLRIYGALGMIYLEERDAGTINVAYNDGGAEQIPYEVQKGFYNELLNFHNALTGSEEISVTPEIEYGDLKVIMSILRSIEEERVVSIDDNIPESQMPTDPYYQNPPNIIH